MSENCIYKQQHTDFFYKYSIATLTRVCPWSQFLHRMLSVIPYRIGLPMQVHLPLKTVLFGRGLYPGADSDYAMMEASKFKTIIVSSYYLGPGGDVYSGDDPASPIIQNGKYVGDTAFLRRVDTLKHYARVEFLREGVAKYLRRLGNAVTPRAPPGKRHAKQALIVYLPPINPTFPHRYKSPI